MIPPLEDGIRFRPISETTPSDTAPDAGPPLVRLDRISKSFGPTVANEEIRLSVMPGEAVGLVGANGAGKSTLMRILCGVVEPDSGSLAILGRPLGRGDHSPAAARRNGIRIVYQELSLCTNLTVAENFYLEEPGLAGRGLRWRSACRTLAGKAIEGVFPGSGIDPEARVGDLPIGQRQMVEIARAASDPGLKLLILDEPTSSLDSGRAAQLHDYVRRRTAEGVSFIFISHKLREVIGVSSRIVVMRNGRIVSEGGVQGVSVHDLVELMGGRAGQGRVAGGSAREARPGAGREPLLRISGEAVAALGHELEFHAGDVVGLAGLEGGGQKALLHRIRRSAAGHGEPGLDCRTSAGFVSGDRQREGVFPLWSVQANIGVGALARRPLSGLVSAARERETAEHWAGRLGLDPGRLSSDMPHLSGGNQQKALVARALASRSGMLLLDDPTRGVDVAAKNDFYAVVREAARSGALVVWYSSENVELLECNRVLVLHEGRIVRELVETEISEENIVGSAFLQEVAGRPASGRAAREPAGSTGTKRAGTRGALRAAALTPMLGLALVLGALAMLNPAAVSPFGLDLLLSAAVPLVLIALAQMFVVGGSQIDLGVGAFAGLSNVIGATILVDRPALGAGMLLMGLAGYGVIGALIERRRIPAIVVTLGASFVWLGCGYTLQPAPGGSSPDWLMAAVSWQIPGLPTSVALILLAGLAGLAIDRSRLGLVLRGFGNNPTALAQGGWSPLRFTVLRYLLAGAFAMTAGLSLTAITTASDINAGSAFTLLSIASVVIGGCRLLGGVVTPVGVTAGAVTLSLIGSLLSFLGIGTDYNAAVQGALLIAVLALRTALDREEEE
jgi:ribose transport system ATP-binding protein